MDPQLQQTLPNFTELCSKDQRTRTHTCTHKILLAQSFMLCHCLWFIRSAILSQPRSPSSTPFTNQVFPQLKSRIQSKSDATADPAAFVQPFCPEVEHQQCNLSATCSPENKRALLSTLKLSHTQRRPHSRAHNPQKPLAKGMKIIQQWGTWEMLEFYVNHKDQHV